MIHPVTISSLPEPSLPEPSSFIGCDVGKAQIVVFDQPSGQTRTILNQTAELAAFAAGLEANCLVVCEATGGYEATLLAAVTKAGRAAHRADARKVKAFIRSFGTLGKTDAIDARALAQYGKERHASLTRWQPPETERQHLQTLVLMRRDLVATHVAWNNRRQAPGAEVANDLFVNLLTCIKQQIADLDRQIQALMTNSKPLAEANTILRAIAGIGPKTAAALIALMPELGTLDRRRAAALAGLAPHPRQSGASDAYRATRGGRPEVKRVLFMAAMAARKSDPNLRAFFQRLTAAGKKPIVAITAIMRKLIVIANARLRDANLTQLS